MKLDPSVKQQVQEEIDFVLEMHDKLKLPPIDDLWHIYINTVIMPTSIFRAMNHAGINTSFLIYVSGFVMAALSEYHHGDLTTVRDQIENIKRHNEEVGPFEDEELEYEH